MNISAPLSIRFKPLLLLAATAAALLSGCGRGPQSSLPAARDPEQKQAFSVSQTTASTAAVPSHVQTAEYLLTSTEIATNPSLYAPYLTWAYAKTDHLGIVRAAGIKTVVYTDLLMPKNGDPFEYPLITGSDANLQTKDCSGNSVTFDSGTRYLTDVTQSAAGSFVSKVVNDYVNYVNSSNAGYTNPFDLIFIDSANSFYGISAMPCNFNASTWTTDMDTAIAAEPYPTIINTLSTSASQVSNQVAGLQASNIAGGEYEHCFNDRQWSVEEQAQIQTLSLLKSEGKPAGPGYWCYLDGTSADASTVIPQRLFAYASFLLTYDPNYSVFQESFASPPSTFKVMPETGFVPLSPASVPGSISALKSSTGTYVQKYGACYYRGSLVGRCEIVVNPDASHSFSVPSTTFHHAAALSGEGVLDGGTMKFGAKKPTSLGPMTAAILTP
jgi:hypothetical protein